MTVLFVNEQRVTSLPEDWPALLSHGTEDYEWRVLDRDRRHLFTLGVVEVDDQGIRVPGSSGVTGGSLDFNRDAETRGSGSFTWTGPRAEQPDWTTVLVQPWYRLTAVDGTVFSWPLGVFVPSTPREEHGDGDWVTVPVDMYDLTLRLRQQALGFDPYVTNLVDPLVVFAREIIGYAGLDHLIEDDDRRGRTPMVFMPGSENATFMHIVNRVLDAAGFFGAWADGEGLIRSQRYVAPGQRPVEWVFEDVQQNASYDPRYDLELDWFTIPNRVIAVSQDTGETEQLIAEAYNDDLDDPLSIVNRGPVDETLPPVDVADQETLQLHADRALAERRSRGAKIGPLKHLPLPLEVNARVDFVRVATGVRMPGVLRTMHVECEPGSLWTSEIVEVKG